MRGALASGAFVGILLNALAAHGQGPPPAPPAPEPAPAEPPAPTTAPTAEPPPPPPETTPPPATQGSVPPVSAVAVGTPSTSGTSPPPAVPPKDEPAPKAIPKASDPWQDAHAIAVEGSIGVNGRIGPSSVEPAEEEHAGVAFDVSGWYTLSKEYVLGLGFTYADLGNVTAGSGGNGFDADYSVTAIYLGARAFPWRSENAEIFLGLRVGLAWQGIDALGIRTLEPNVAPPTAYACSGVSGPGIGLGAGIGGALRLGARAWLMGHVDASGYKMTSDVVEDCAPGLGSVTSVSVGAGLLYAFDLGAGASLEAKAPSSGRAQTW